MPLNRTNLDQHAESRRPRTRSESRCAEEGELNSSEVTDPVEQEAEGELRDIPGLDTDSSSDEQFDQ